MLVRKCEARALSDLYTRTVTPLPPLASPTFHSCFPHSRSMRAHTPEPFPPRTLPRASIALAADIAHKGAVPAGPRRLLGPGPARPAQG
eukprot:364646-Chlamydomonas_euryale.AAC.3